MQINSKVPLKKLVCGRNFYLHCKTGHSRNLIIGASWIAINKQLIWGQLIQWFES